MSLTKKVTSVGVTASLLASLFATALAPTALGAVTVNPAGLVPVGGTSANTVTFTFTEQSATSFGTVAGDNGCFHVWIGDSGETAPLATDTTVQPAGHVSFSGTPVVTGSTGSLGASAAIVNAGNDLRVCYSGTDPTAIESIIVSGLKISASTAAVTGAIQAQLFNFSGDATVAAVQSGGTASGKLDVNYPIGTTSVVVNLQTTGCEFVNTAGAPGAYVFSSNGESTEGTTAAAAGGQQTLTLTTATGAVHDANEIVTQTNACAPNGVIASPGTIASALGYSSAGNFTVFPGESNSAAANLLFTEGADGLLPAGATLTLTIGTANVVFSARPQVTVTAGTGLTFVGQVGTTAPMVLSADRKSATITVATASTAAASFNVNRIFYDVGASVPGGTFISVTASVSGGILVVPTSNTNAVVNLGITATATPTTVFIGQNAQKTGLVTLTELQAGFFQAGIGTNNTIVVCIADANASFTSPGPTAKVTAGDIVLREGDVASTDNIVTGTPIFEPGFDDTCYMWKVWTASTKASTIVIGNADLSSGPLIDVFTDEPQGPVNMQVFIGDASVLTDLGPDDVPAAVVTIANAVFQNQVVVTALSQPSIPAGSTDALAGNLQVAETGIGQLKLGETICVQVLPRTSNNAIQDTFLKALTTADLPIAAASGGLVISPIGVSNQPCSTTDGQAAQFVPTTGPHMISFAFRVDQQSTTGTGKVVISNIHYITTADAPKGPVLVNVFGFGGSPTFVEFQATVSNAIIGNGQFISTDSAVGVTKSGPFSVSTKVVKKGAYVTIRFETTPALAGAKLGIWIAKKGAGGTWSAYSPHTSRIADGKGVVYYYYKAGSVAWLSFKAVYVSNGINPSASSPGIQARWK